MRTVILYGLLTFYFAVVGFCSYKIINSIKMKKIITCAMISILIIGFLFLAFSFGNWNLNPARWDSLTRGFFAFLSLVIPFAVFGIASDLTPK